MQRPRRRVLLVINQLAPTGGAEVQLFHLARGLAAAGHEVTVCCIDFSSVPADQVAASGVTVVELHASNRYRRAAAIPRLIALARRAEVVQCTMWDPSLWGRIAAILARRPVIVADHATDRSIQVAADGAARASWIALHNRLLDPFTYATVACATSQGAVLRGEGVAAEKIVHIPNGIPIAQIAAAARGADRVHLGLPSGGPLAMQVGVFRPEKNQLGGLEAFARLHERVPEAQLVFVGDGSQRERVERRAAELGAARKWVHFLGMRADVPELLSQADLMLLPSFADAMPMTVLESMAVGTPVLASDVGDVRQALGEAGVCVTAGDLDALAAEGARLLADPALRERLGRAGTERARGFDAAAMTRRYEALFEAALAGEPPIPAVAAAG